MSRYERPAVLRNHFGYTLDMIMPVHAERRENSTAMLAEAICRLRRDRGLTQEALAKAAKVSRVTVNRIENGHQTPEWEVLCALADALEVSLDEFRR